VIAAPENPRASPTSPDVPPHPAVGGGTDTSRPDAPDVCVILDDVRSLYNVGAVMRACDGAGIFTVHACGITPFPPAGLDLRDDPRRGPVAARAARELRKVALSAYDTVRMTHWPDASEAIAHVRGYGATVVAVETSPNAVRYRGASVLRARPLALVFGHEVYGVSAEVLGMCDSVVSIPMRGAGRSLNVAVACGVVCYEAIHAG
jgi:23S rRNA (guanosine2251-2'-O)-methyltransferase